MVSGKVAWNLEGTGSREVEAETSFTGTDLSICPLSGANPQCLSSPAFDSYTAAEQLGLIISENLQRDKKNNSLPSIQASRRDGSNHLAENHRQERIEYQVDSCRSSTL